MQKTQLIYHIAYSNLWVKTVRKSVTKTAAVKLKLHLFDLLWNCCTALRLVVDLIYLVVQQIHNKSNQWSSGASILWGNDARCVIEISGGGVKKLLEILYNVMQRPVGHDQRAYSTSICCDNPTERGYFCQMITYRTSSIHSATCTCTWNSKLTTSSQKTWLIKVLIFMSKML